LGKYRYLLFDISRTGLHKSGDNTFFSEIDVVDGNAPPREAIADVKARGDKPDPRGL
jgi:hypothetical protein